jgi:hypothetical protein
MKENDLVNSNHWIAKFNLVSLVQILVILYFLCFVKVLALIIPTGYPGPFHIGGLDHMHLT